MSEAAAVLLWGGKGSGKSGFVGALWHAGGTHDNDVGRWCISPGDIHDTVTKNYLIDAYTMLREGHRRATMPSPDYPSLLMTARKWIAGSPRAALDLSFKDPAGEYADDPRRAREQGGALLDELRTCAGVVWLFDCLAESKPHFDQIIRHIGTLRQRSGGRAIETPIAFCLSRIDLIGEDARDWLRNNPEAALRETLGEDVMAQLDGVFPNRKYFAISSKGFTEGRVQPEGLNDVLNWIYANQRKERMIGYGRRWARHGAVAALLLLLVWAAARAAKEYRNSPAMVQRKVATEQALAQLERAGRFYAQGRADSTVALLRDSELPDDHERAIDRDTLLAYAAHQVGSTRILAGGDADTLLDLVLEHAKRAAKQLRDPAAAARVRYVRAEACMLKRCTTDDIIEDLEFVVEHAKDRQLIANARERLGELRR
jgi:hypothetical protein